jgi:hypothetical protein
MGYGDPWKQQTKNKVVRGTPEAWAGEKRRRMRLECNHGISDQGARQCLLLKRERMLNMVIRKSLGMEIGKLMVVSSIRLQEPGDRLLWKCRPPPKRKR